MRWRYFLALSVLLMFTAFIGGQSPAWAAPGVPLMIPYSGTIAANGTPFNGTGQFKFAIVNANGSTTYWSNNNTSTAGSEPTNFVSISVTEGVFSVKLGDTSAPFSMLAIAGAVFTANDTTYLRIWFNDGVTGFQMLTPDRQLVSVPYAYRAEAADTLIGEGVVGTAQIAAGAVTGTKIANGTIGSAQIAAGSVGPAQIAAGSIGSTQIAPGAVTGNKIANGAIGTSQINTAEVQNRITGSCALGSSISAVNTDGSVICTRPTLYSVGPPTNHVTIGSIWGQWMSDPIETLGSGKIWVMDGYSEGTTITEYASLANMISSTSPTSWDLTNGYDGTGAVVYGGFLYYNKANSRNMIKYNLKTRVQVLDVELPNAGFRNTYYYQWGGYSDIDFAVDEEGLWVIYATPGNSGNIVVSKLDPSDLSLTQTWNTSRLKSAGNAFMISGVLYVIASYSATNTYIDYKYDTRTSTEATINIPFTNPGAYNSMVAYNPHERVLYSWDNSRHQTYPLYW